MKKLILYIIALALILCACGQTPSKPSSIVPEKNTSTYWETEDGLASLSTEETDELNKFLAYLSSYYFESIPNEIDRKFEFAHMYLEYTYDPLGEQLLVRNDNTENAHDQETGIPANVLDAVLHRFYGESIPHMPSTNLDASYTYEDEVFWTNAILGSWFFENDVMATDIQNNNDGTYTVYFNEYDGPPEYSREENLKYTVPIERKAVLRLKVVDGVHTYEFVRFI